MTGNLKDWLALNNILVWRSQHLGSISSLGSLEHSPGKEMHWRCWYCTCVLLGVPIVPWHLIPVKPLNGFRIPALWQRTSSTLRSEDILYTRDSTTDILNVCFLNLQFKIRHSEIFWRHNRGELPYIYARVEETVWGLSLLIHGLPMYVRFTSDWTLTAPL